MENLRESHTLFISDERKFELFKKNYEKYLGGTLECSSKEVNGVSVNIVTFPSDLPSTMLIQYVWSIGVSTGLELCQSIINGTTSPISPLTSFSVTTSPISPLDKAGEEPEKTL